MTGGPGPAPLPPAMRVARLHRWGDVRVEEVEVPRPGPGELLLRIDACGVCGSDALVWYVEGKAPAVLGHEVAGTVVDVGEGVGGFRVGERLFVHHHAPCLRCPECARGNWPACPSWREAALVPGGFAEYAVARPGAVAGDVLRLPPGVDAEAGSFVEPLACCVRALRRHGRLAPGEAVHVVGLGGMGLLFVQLARAWGAAPVTGSDFVEERRALALELGADGAWDPGRGDVAGAVRETTGGRGADVVVVSPGDPEAAVAGIRCAGHGARVVLFTPFPPDRPLVLDQSALYFREVAVANSYSSGPDETAEALLLLAGGRVRTDRLVTHRCGLDGVGEALERAARKGGAEGVKTVVFPHGLPREGAPEGGTA